MIHFEPRRHQEHKSTYPSPPSHDYPISLPLPSPALSASASVCCLFGCVCQRVRAYLCLFPLCLSLFARVYFPTVSVCPCRFVKGCNQQRDVVEGKSRVRRCICSMSDVLSFAGCHSSWPLTESGGFRFPLLHIQTLTTRTVEGRGEESKGRAIRQEYCIKQRRNGKRLSRMGAQCKRWLGDRWPLRCLGRQWVICRSDHKCCVASPKTSRMREGGFCDRLLCLCKVQVRCGA